MISCLFRSTYLFITDFLLVVALCMPSAITSKTRTEGNKSSSLAQVEQLTVRLEAEQAERERLAQTKQDMEREAQAMRAQIHSLSRELSSQAPEQAPAADQGDPQAWEENSQLRQEVMAASPFSIQETSKFLSSVSRCLAIVMLLSLLSCCFLTPCHGSVVAADISLYDAPLAARVGTLWF